MARNARFQPAGEPFSQDPSLQLDDDKVHGPITFLNPTQAHFTHVAPAKAGSDPDSENVDIGDSKNSVRFKWTSRNNRKGRHALIITPEDIKDEQYSTPAPSTSAMEILKGIWRMFTYFPVWDVSWLVAFVFTLGSIVWVLNAFFTFMPAIRGSGTFSGEVLYGGGITAFVGATIFEIGSFLLMLEAVNGNRAGCFGWAVEQIFEEHSASGDGVKGAITSVRADKAACSHHHQNTKNLVGKPTSIKTSTDDASKSHADSNPGSRSWVWWPSSSDLRTHYIHDLGFLACCAQTFGATIFWISGFTALPGIYNHMSPGLTDGVYWTPQVVGGCGFIVSGALFMIETQKRWYLPALDTLGWHIGLWNLIGGIGFTLCPAFGYDSASWAQFQAGCSTFWGSWAFLIGSALQWYESLDKNPVEVDKEKP